MEILRALSREHRLFDRLLERMDVCLRDGKTAVPEVQKLLLALFMALDQHEEMEEKLVTLSRAGSGAEIDDTLVMDVQHQKIRITRDQTLEALRRQHGGTPSKHLKSLALGLIDALRRHFRFEEERLWPQYERALSRSLGGSIAHRLSRWLELFERGAARREETLAGYFVAYPHPK